MDSVIVTNNQTQKGFIMSLLLLCSLFFTEQASAGFFDNFKPRENDISVQFLSMIFGEVGGPDAMDERVRGQSSFAGAMIGTFNSGMLYLAMILIVYQIVLSTYDTARSGRFLGENGSYWLPIRAAIGIALLFPNGTQYCLAQAIVMTIIYGGIGLGDTLWDEVFYYTESSNILYDETPLKLEDFSKSSIVTVAKGASCLAALQYQAEIDQEDHNYTVFLDEDTSGNVQVKYGRVNQNGSMVDYGTCLYSQEYLDKKHGLAVKNASLNMVPDFVKYYKGELDSADMRELLYLHYGKMVDELNNDFCVFELDLSAEAEQATKYGWLTAGMYVRKMFELNSGNSPNAPCAEPPVLSDSGYVTEMLDIALTTTRKTFDSYSVKVPFLVKGAIQLAELEAAAQENPGASINDDSAAALDDFKSNAKGMGKTTTWNPLKTYGDYFASDSGRNIYNYNVEDGRIKMQDPFSGAVSSGYKLMQITVYIHLGVAIMMVMGAIGVSFMSAASPLPHAYQIISGIVWVFVASFTSLFFMLGSLLAVYLPLIPMLAFIVAAMGWFIYVFLAMVSAPIVALGILWPDKDDGLMGKATPAILMYLNLLLRPGLMIIGLLAGLLACSIGFFLVVAAFQIGYENGIMNVSEGIVFHMIPIGFAFVYTMVAIAQKSFMLIGLLPDRVLTWIGGQSLSFSQDGARILQAARQSHEEGVQAVKEIHSQGQGIIQKFGSNMVERAAERKEEDKKAKEKSKLVGEQKKLDTGESTEKNEEETEETTQTEAQKEERVKELKAKLTQKLSMSESHDAGEEVEEEIAKTVGGPNTFTQCITKMREALLPDSSPKEASDAGGDSPAISEGTSMRRPAQNIVKENLELDPSGEVSPEHKEAKPLGSVESAVVADNAENVLSSAIKDIKSLMKEYGYTEEETQFVESEMEERRVRMVEQIRREAKTIVEVEEIINKTREQALAVMQQIENKPSFSQDEIAGIFKEESKAAGK